MKIPNLVTGVTARLPQVTFGSLFSGIGGFDLGFEQAGMQCKWQVEIDPYCNRVLAKHWPNVRRWGDVRTFPPVAWQECPCCDNCVCSWHGCHAHDCPEEECPAVEEWEERWGVTPYDSFHPGWRVDVICGGDPCQANSKANSPHGSICEALGGEFVRIVDALRPRVVVRENPPSRKDAPWTWQRFRAELECLGYACLPFRLRGCCLGADCQRERVFVLGTLERSKGVRLEGRDGKAANGRREPRRVQAPMETGNRVHVPRPRGYGSRADIPGGVDRIRAIGNAVCPCVSEWIGDRIMEALCESRT